MECYEKKLVKNTKDVQSLLDSWKDLKYLSFLKVEDVEEFPAVISYYVDENDYNMSHSAYIYYSITYLKDFEE